MTPPRTVTITIDDQTAVYLDAMVALQSQELRRAEPSRSPDPDVLLARAVALAVNCGARAMLHEATGPNGIPLRD